MDADFLHETENGVLLSVKLQPRASSNQVCDPLGGELRIRVTAPPVDSAANEALVEFLSKKLGCPKRHVELVRGQTSRHKTLRLHGLSVTEVLEKLKPAK